MTTWQKISMAVRFFFGGFEAATDYALNLVNALIADGIAAKRVAQARDVLASALGYLTKYAEYCPAKWTAEYAHVVDVVRHLSDALADGQITSAEVQAAIEGVKIAIADWRKDD